ncbi:ribosomal RNA adenine dimethylase domain-containing protein [Ditylenchus destructor]|nr:ribosomal RNA adenine dimethylase domain-containing protein [Ditylenchus destructor]
MSAFAFSQGNISTNDAKQLDEFNTYLASRAYVNGLAPSKQDVVAYNNFSSAPAQKYPHIVRWYTNIDSFENKERAMWSNQSRDDEAAGRGNDNLNLSGGESEDDEEKERFRFAVTTSFDIESLKKSDSELVHSPTYERQWLLPGSEYWGILQTDKNCCRFDPDDFDSATAKTISDLLDEFRVLNERGDLSDARKKMAEAMHLQMDVDKCKDKGFVHPRILYSYGLQNESEAASKAKKGKRESLIDAFGFYRRALENDSTDEQIRSKLQSIMGTIDAYDNEQLRALYHKRDELWALVGNDSEKWKPVLRDAFFLQIYNTCAIEGNTLSLNEVCQCFNKGQMPSTNNPIPKSKKEVISMGIAFAELVTSYEGKFLRYNMLLDLNSLINSHDKSVAEGLRANDKFITPAEFEQRLNSFLSWLKKNMTSCDAIDGHSLSLLAHYSLVLLHPFYDGNGRTSRLIGDYVLMSYGFPPVNIPETKKDEYGELLKTADNGDLRPLLRFVCDCMDCTLDALIEKLSSNTNVHEIKGETSTNSQPNPNTSNWFNLYANALDPIFSNNRSSNAPPTFNWFKLNNMANKARTAFWSAPNMLPPLPSLQDFIYMFKLNAKKVFSQNYIMDMHITRRMVRMAGDVDSGFVAEIGPGPGSITRAILERHVDRLDVVELDERFIPPLEILKNASADRMHIHKGDILKTDIGSIWKEAGAEKLAWYDEELPPLNIVGNLPFNIATPLIIKYLREMSRRTGPWVFGRVPLTLSFQWEVARRMVAEVGSHERSRLSIVAQYVSDPKIVMKLGGSSFVPRPEVDVGLVRFVPRTMPLIPAPFEVVSKVATHVFIYKNKHVKNCLATLYPKHMAEDLVADLLKHSRIDAETTSRHIGMDDMRDLCELYMKHCHEHPGLILYKHDHPKVTLEILKDQPNAVPPPYIFPTTGKINAEGLSLADFDKHFG